MKLERPIIWFDLETTGVDTETSRIVQIAAIKIKPSGETEEKNLLINPTIPIPAECTEVHGITDDMVKDKPTFKQYAQSMSDWFKDCDLGGFNSDGYDIPLLSAEFERAEVVFLNWDYNLLDVMKLYRQLFPNTLGEIYKRLFKKELDGAHDALVDIAATKAIFEKICPKELKTSKQVDEFLQGDKKRVDIAGKLYADTEGIVRYNFGKEKDRDVKENPGFGKWMLGQSFAQDTKNKLKELI